MLSKKDLFKTKEYWIEELQTEIYRQVVYYMAANDLSQNDLAEKWGVSKWYVSQLIKGKCNFSLKKLVELSLALEVVPIIEYVELDKYYEHKVEMNYLDEQIRILN